MKIAFLTAGGIAPCLSSSIGFLLKEYYDYDNGTEFIGYLNGYKGLLSGNSIKLSSIVFFCHEEKRISINIILRTTVIT